MLYKMTSEISHLFFFSFLLHFLNKYQNLDLSERCKLWYHISQNFNQTKKNLPRNDIGHKLLQTHFIDFHAFFNILCDTVLYLWYIKKTIDMQWWLYEQIIFQDHFLWNIECVNSILLYLKNFENSWTSRQK
jgi:hypothetical protein